MAVLAPPEVIADDVASRDSHATPAGAPGKLTSVSESLTRGALALLSTQPLTWGVSLLSVIVVPQLLGSEALGQYTIAASIATLAFTGISLGIPDYMVRRFAQQPITRRRDAAIALVLPTIIAAIGALILALVVPLAGLRLGDVRLLYVALAGMVAMPAQAVLLSSFRGREQHSRYAWFNASSVVISTVGGVVVLLLGGQVLGYAITVVGLTIAATLVAWKLSGLRLVRSDLHASILTDFREFVRGGFPFLTGNLAVSLTGGIDRVLLGLFVSAAEVGWYAAAFRIIAIPLFLPTLIVTPLFPVLSRSTHEPETIRRTVTQTLRIILLVMVPLSAGIVVVAPVVPTLLGWPMDFEHAVPLMMALSVQLPIVAVDMVLGVVLMAIGRQRPWVTLQIATAGLKIALNVLAIPAFEQLMGNGALGASLVTIGAELVMAVGAFVLIPKHLVDPRVVWDACRIVVAGAATVLIGSLLLPVSLWLAIPGGAIAYVSVAVVSRALTVNDLRYLIRRVARSG